MANSRTKKKTTKKKTTKKTVAKKKTVRKKAVRKKATKRKKPSVFSKLDPCLILGASHSKVAHKLGIVEKPVTELASSSSKIGLGIRSLADRMSIKAANDYVQEDIVSVLIESTDVASIQKKIKSLKGISVPLTPSKLMAKIPRSKLKYFAGLSAIGYIEASTRLKPTCDLAHISTGLVVSGSTTVSETGNGVLIGIIDTGIDVTHPAFQSGGSTRIVNYLDQETGDEFSQADINAGNADGSTDIIGHGTHVAGIAAGNGAGSPSSNWRGVAPQADLAIVKTTFDTADIAIGIKHVFDLAQTRNQPCVV